MRKIFHKDIVDYDLTPIASEFLSYAPAYARTEAAEAISKVQELQSQGFLRKGVYYIVLADIVGATKFAAEWGNEALEFRIKYFVKSSFDALNQIILANIAVFIREIGDAVLFVFSHFPDILRWHDSFESYLNVLNVNDTNHEPLIFRTIIHLGEVYLNGVTPISLAVSQLFKSEKKAGPGEIILTETAYQAAWPSIARAYHAFEQTGAIGIEGRAGELALYKLITTDISPAIRLADENLQE